MYPFFYMYVNVFMYLCKSMHSHQNGMAGEALRYIRFYLCMFIGLVKIVKNNIFSVKFS